jgi:hypothetical protein|uniref:DUF4416 family protein n=1 Tax=candidate division WOR-3 bacterium TaxID=2052148 RepID=A0A7C6A8T8_UNCW3
MTEIKLPPPGCLIIGIIAQPALNESDVLREVEPFLEKAFGPIQHKSPIIDFDFTDYYEVEMGKNLLRLWLSFANLVSPENLLAIKLQTMEIEKKFRDANGRRRINLDPGILTLCNLCLATTKNYYHRIYLGKGIYAEVTLVYRHKNFETLAWTYPDYRTPLALSFFQLVRDSLLATLGKE